MLSTLTIQNVVLVESLTVEFHAGLCALTGETGAGKSILLDSLGLALGNRSDASLVRKGTDKAQVSAVFDIPDNHPAHALLEENGLQSDATLVLRRIVGADGRSRAFINDQPVSAGLLAQIGALLVEIHGQFDTQGLLDPATHLELLDEYAGTGKGVYALWQDWRSARDRLAELEEGAQSARREEDYLRQALDDLADLDPKEGEEETLAGLRERLMNKGAVLDALNQAYEALNGEHDPVRAASSVLGRAAAKAGEVLDGALAALDRANAEIQEALGIIQSVSADLQEGDYDLESVDDRLHALRAQARKHQCAPDDLPRVQQELADKLRLIDHAGDMLDAQRAEVDRARKSYEIKAHEVSALRKAAAARLDTLVKEELAPLKLDKARFVTRIEALPESEWNAQGMDKVRFLVATNPGSEPGPLNKIASGGEMSRFMLALKVVMAETGAAQTLVFDEVDAGIGGAVADAVGERLGRLAIKRQILVVTHAPQVAARASTHLIVRKDGQDDVRTNVLPLQGLAERREEIARMLSGATITEEARAAAARLLEWAA